MQMVGADLGRLNELSVCAKVSYIFRLEFHLNFCIFKRFTLRIVYKVVVDFMVSSLRIFFVLRFCFFIRIW